MSEEQGTAPVDEPGASVAVAVEEEQETRTRKLPPYNVIILNDEEHTFQYVIELLVKRGARLDVKDKEGRTALRWAEGVFLAAVGAEKKPATIALLEKLGAKP